MVPLVCPFCHQRLDPQATAYHCGTCQKHYPITHGIPLFSPIVPFYETSGTGRGVYPATRITARRGLKKWFYRPYQWLHLKLRTEHFQDQHLVRFGEDLLDVGCGGGNEKYNQVGRVTGVDVSVAALLEARTVYQQVVQSDAARLPFPDQSFDQIICNHFLEHVHPHHKDAVLGEMYRVLKNGGQWMGAIPVWGKNPWFRLAARYPDIVGQRWIQDFGHIGLESATQNMERLRNAGFSIDRVEKMYTVIWPTGTYGLNFNNEFKEKSAVIAMLVGMEQALAVLDGPKHHYLDQAVNCLLGAAAYAVDVFLPPDAATAINVLCRKK
jgi:ubiquinone/menaquinone biosynthesis C-methylase UbiE